MFNWLKFATPFFFQCLICSRTTFLLYFNWFTIGNERKVFCQTFFFSSCFRRQALMSWNAMVTNELYSNYCRTRCYASIAGRKHLMWEQRKYTIVMYIKCRGVHIQQVMRRIGQGWRKAKIVGRQRALNLCISVHFLFHFFGGNFEKEMNLYSVPS